MILKLEDNWCALDRFSKNLFFYFKKRQVNSMDDCQAEQISEKYFFPNVAPSASSGTPPPTYILTFNALFRDTPHAYQCVTLDT